MEICGEPFNAGPLDRLREAFTLSAEEVTTAFRELEVTTAIDLEAVGQCVVVDLLKATRAGQEEIIVAQLEMGCLCPKLAT